MEAPRRVSIRQTRRSNRLWVFIGLAIVIFLVVVIVPPAVVLRNEDNSVTDGQPATALIPLYSYPEKNAWDPLFKAIKENSDLKWIIVVNVDSGPGNTAIRNDEFADGIQRLNSHPNVQTVGYVRTGYGGRNKSDILQDIDAYSNWTSAASGLSMHGIFFDEAWSGSSPDAADMSFEVNQYAKQSSGIATPRIVIRNPGVLHDNGLHFNNTDITVVCEETLEDYHRLEPSLESSPLSRSETAYIIHSAGQGKLRGAVAKMSYRAEYIFVTTRKEDPYGKLSGDFQDFAKAMPT